MTIGFPSYSSPRPLGSIRRSAPAVASGAPALHTRICSIFITPWYESPNTHRVSGFVSLLLALGEAWQKDT